MFNKICHIFQFLCEIQLDIPKEHSTMSMGQGGLVSFDHCQKGCDAKGAQIINKEYFDYLFMVSIFIKGSFYI